MPRWQRCTADTCQNVYYDNQGYTQLIHLMLTRNFEILSQAPFRLVGKAVEAKQDAAIVVPTRDTPTGF